MGYDYLVWRIDYDTAFLNKLGLIKWFSGVLAESVGGLGVSGTAAGVILVLAYMYAHYMFASTTAHITAMFGAFLAAAVSLNAPAMPTALMMAAASNIMMTLTHYATGTSTCDFRLGLHHNGRMVEGGFCHERSQFSDFSVIGSIWWKVLGYW